MKITISCYEGQPEFSSHSIEMSDETGLSDFIDHLEHLVRGIYPGIVLDVAKENDDDSA